VFTASTLCVIRTAPTVRSPRTTGTAVKSRSSSRTSLRRSPCTGWPVRSTSEISGRDPYEVPSIVAVPIIDGGPDYLRWILDETEQLA
jgi:periplasmic divalent cation tolerance protein